MSERSGMVRPQQHVCSRNSSIFGYERNSTSTTNINNLVGLDWKEATYSVRWEEFVAHSACVTCLALGRKSGRVMATGGEDKKVNLWTIGKPHCVMSLAGHTSAIECVRFGKHEDTLCAGSSTGAIKIWDLEAAKIIRTLTGHKGSTKCIDFHPHGDFIASGSCDNTIKLWDIRRKGCIFTYKGHKEAVHKLKFSPDGRWIASGGDEHTVRLWDLAAGKLLFELQAHSASVTDLEFHPNEFLLASGSSDGTVKFWDLENYSMVSSTDIESGPIKCVLFNPDGQCLFSGSEDLLKVYGWEPATTYDTLVMGWGAVYDLTTSENQLIAGAFCSTNVSVYVVDLKRVNLVAPCSDQSELTFDTDSSPKKGFLEKFFNPNDTYVISCPTSPLKSHLHHNHHHLKNGSEIFLPPLDSVGNRRLRRCERKPPSTSDPAAAILVQPLSITYRKAPSRISRKPVGKLSTVSGYVSNSDSTSIVPSVSIISKSDLEEDGVCQQIRKVVDFVSEGRDKSLALDLEDFLPRYYHESMCLGLQTQPEVSDAEVMSSIFRGHESMRTVLSHRRKNLLIVIALWHRKGVKMAMEGALHLKDTSVLVDILNIVCFKPTTWTLDMCQILLPAIFELLHSKYETYVAVGCQSLKLIVKNFAPLIKTNIMAPKGVGVDISREERYKKCINCMKQLFSIRSSIVKKQDVQGKLGHCFRELNILLQALE